MKSLAPLPDGPRLRVLEAAHLQAIEGNPLTSDELAMFEMFEREGWTQEHQRAYVLDQLRKRRSPHAAE